MRSFLLVILLGSAALAAPQRPTPEAARWWQLTSELSSDAMQGRDTGTEAYARAATLVAHHFAAAGLRPVGDHGTFFQSVPMHQVDLDLTRSSLTLNSTGRPPVPLTLLQQVTLTPRPSGLHLDLVAPMIFVGYGDRLPDPSTLGLKDLQGTVAVFFSATPTGLSPEARSAFLAHRAETLRSARFALTLAIDNPAATEPFHWPAAYSRSVTLASEHPSAEPPRDPSPPALRISAEAAPRLFAAVPNALFPVLLETSEAGTPLPAFSLNTALSASLQTTEKDIASPNILAVLPGSAAAPQTNLTPSAEFVAVSAHLDGYGFGTPVGGDNLYNGTLDDAAYVATLIELADTLAHAPAAQRPRRSILVCIFTGEEKGLLGSEFFTRHPTVPITQIVADLNLDQLRPIFPLHALTMEGLTDSTLGATARSVAAPLHIELRPDREPERNLFRRADNYNFVRVGVPIASFIFGYDSGSPEERTYRDWYARRYHKPQDDLRTPIDWNAAVTFNRFFHDLTLAIADAPTRPTWTPASPYAPKRP